MKELNQSGISIGIELQISATYKIEIRYANNISVKYL
jgi:hypothetical protein